MANKVTARGSVFQVTIATVLTTVAQCTEFDTGETKSRCIPAECMDDSGHAVEMVNDDVVTQGEGSATIYYDPDSTVHQTLTDWILAGATSFPVAGAWKFADATPASTTFNIEGLGFGAQVAVGGLLTARISVTYSGLLTWPT